MSKELIIIKRNIKIKIPMTPNFLLNAETGTGISISEFTEVDLKRIGAEWTNDLIRRARGKKNI